jgi:phenylacetate-CoA ligase
MDLEKIYINLPSFLQDEVVKWQGKRVLMRRYGVGFSRVMAASQARLTFSPGQLADYRASRLSAHLKYARHSPFWAERFLQYSVNPNASDPFVELAKLPVIGKDEVRLNATRMSNPLFESSRLIQLHTSGTTGSGLLFKETPESEWQRWAVWWRYRNRLGIKFGEKCALFVGRNLVSLGQKAPPFWKISKYTNQVIFSPQHLGPKTFRYYLEAMERHEIPWIHGYSSTLSLLATWMIEYGVGPPCTVRHITVGAENLSDYNKNRIERAFKVKVYQHYGMAESVANFSQEIDGRIYVDEDFSQVEFLPRPDQLTVDIIGTNWHNPAFPLFRYNTGDICTVMDSGAADPRSRQVISIDGRDSDVLYLKNGVSLVRSAVDQIFNDLEQVAEAQIHQSVVGMAEIKVIKGARFEPRDEQLLKNELTKKLGDLCDWKIVYVDELPRTKSGKFRMLVSTVTRPQ